MKRETIGAALVAAAVLLSGISPADAGTARDWAPCAQEDGPGPCVWDAKHRGNGIGQSFIIRKGQEVVYIKHRRAHRMLAR